MSPSSRPAAVAAALAVVLALTACASAAGGPAGGDVPAGVPAAPTGDVVGTGTVLDTGNDPQLCVVVAESYPPQCSGIPLDGWSWDTVEGSETASGVTWGSYAVTGSYDGERMTVTQPPVLLALYDPAPLPDSPAPGNADQATLTRVQAELEPWLGDQLVTSGQADGYLEVTVVWDDGTWQRQADAEYGEGVVVITSLLRSAG